MKGNTEDAVREGAHALVPIPHGLGHMMGLDVHDMENLGEIWGGGYNAQPKAIHSSVANRNVFTFQVGTDLYTR